MLFYTPSPSSLHLHWNITGRQACKGDNEGWRSVGEGRWPTRFHIYSPLLPLMKSPQKLCHPWPPSSNPPRCDWVVNGASNLYQYLNRVLGTKETCSVPLATRLSYSWAATTKWNWNGIYKTMNLVEWGCMDDRFRFVWFCEVRRG